MACSFVLLSWKIAQYLVRDRVGSVYTGNVLGAPVELVEGGMGSGAVEGSRLLWPRGRGSLRELDFLAGGPGSWRECSRGCRESRQVSSDQASEVPVSCSLFHWPCRSRRPRVLERVRPQLSGHDGAYAAVTYLPR